MKNSVARFNVRCRQAAERIRELWDKSIEITQSEEQKEKGEREKEERLFEEMMGKTFKI